MEVYIEYVIIDNLIINYVLLQFTNITLKLNAKRKYMFLSSVLGTIVAIIMPLITLNNFLLIVLKIFLGLSMCLIIKKPKSTKVYLTTFFLFITYTFIMGGMCFGLIYFLNLNTTFSGVVIYGFEIPVGLFVLLGVFYLKILITLINYVKHKNTYSNFYFDVKLKQHNIIVRVTGFLDSGNQLNLSGNGVAVINYKTLIKLVPNLDVKSLVKGNLNFSNLTNAKYIELLNSGGKSKMLTFEVEEMEIADDKNKVITLKNQIIGLAKTNFSGKFDCLLSLELFN